MRVLYWCTSCATLMVGLVLYYQPILGSKDLLATIRRCKLWGGFPIAMPPALSKLLPAAAAADEEDKAQAEAKVKRKRDSVSKGGGGDDVMTKRAKAAAEAKAKSATPEERARLWQKLFGGNSVVTTTVPRESVEPPPLSKVGSQDSDPVPVPAKPTLTLAEALGESGRH